jgi:hypothetical protein
MIDWISLKRMTEYALKIKEEMPWIYENFFHQSDHYHIKLINEIYQYVVDYVADEKFSSGRHTYKNIYIIGSWYGLELYQIFNEMRKDHTLEGTEVKFTFIDRNKDFIKAINIMKDILDDPYISTVQAHIEFADIDFSDADLILIPYAEEIMPIQNLNLNATCPIVAAFTHHRYQRVRNRNFSEPIESITDIHMSDLQRKYLQRLGNNDDDWVYTDIVTMDLTKD